MTAKAKFEHPLGLSRREWSIIRSCAWAWTKVDNGHFLVPDHEAKAAQLLMHKGFVTRADYLWWFGGQKPSTIVVMTPQNVAAYNSALDATGVPQPDAEGGERT